MFAIQPSRCLHEFQSPVQIKEKKPKGRALPAWYYFLLAVVIFLAAALTLSNHYQLGGYTRLGASDTQMDGTCLAYRLCMGSKIPDFMDTDQYGGRSHLWI